VRDYFFLGKGGGGVEDNFTSGQKASQEKFSGSRIGKYLSIIKIK
jgi:hypothetical protein